MNKCGACGKFVSLAESIKCSKCGTIYDRACVALPGTGRIIGTWVCPTCTSKQPRDNNSETPVKGVGSKQAVKDNLPSANASGVNEATDLALQMKLLREEIVNFRSEIVRLRAVVDTFDDRMTTIEKRLSTLEQRNGSESHGDHNSALATTVAKLQQELNERDQELLLNDVEVTNLPEDTGENTTHLVTLIAAKLGITLDVRDVVSAVRVGPSRRNSPPNYVTEHSVGAAYPARSGPRPVVVRLARRSLRDELLRAARVRRGATSAELGLQQEPQRFYVNERLTKHNRQLFYKVRENARMVNWKYVWTRDGRIFIRKEQGKPVHRIRTDSDCNNIFDSEKVGPKTN